MGSSIFKSIRKSYSVHFLLTSVMANIMVIGEPAMAMISNHYTSKNKIVSYNSSGYSGGINPILSNDIEDDNSEDQLGKLSTVNELNIPNNFIEETIYYSDQKLGVIGRGSEVEVENPYDNVFKVNLPEVNFDEYEAILQYELYGVLNAAQTTKSINNNGAYGGELIIKNNEWTRVNEVLPSGQLTSGINEIFFNRREDTYYAYKVKNLSVQLIKKQKQKLNIITQDLDSYNKTMYVVGLVNDSNIVKVKVLDQEIDVTNGIFEVIVSGVQNDLEQIEVVLVDKDNSQEVYNKSISHKADTVDFILNDLNLTTTLFDYENLDQGCVDHKALSYTPKDFAQLNEKSKVLIAGLPFKDVRSINEDIDNVTAGDYYGYRVKNLNLSNEGQAEIRLKYDIDKIPSGYGPKDVKTFFYDRTQNSWKALPVDEIDYENQEIVSTLPANETDYINGVIKVPDSPETASFAPTTITDMKYADPTAGIVSIAPPTANNTGAATTSFPIKLPAGRNGMQPNLAVNYNSEGGNGWMGIGWNISTPAITLNTKWGAPRFDTTKETELYSLNGADLVFEVGGTYTSPHREASITRNSTGDRVFYERKEGSYNKIIRHGNSPTNYWWEVIDKQGNKIYYGWDPIVNEIVENSVMRSPNSNPNTNGNIAHWGITYMVDLYGNYIKYSYYKNGNNVFGSAIPAQEQYLQSIEYTLTTNENLLHYYRVDFERNNYTVGTSGPITRNDKIVTVRNGYVHVIDDLLTQIKISYKNNNSTERIRTYSFNYYEEPSFKKSLLKEISEYDAGGNLFYTNKLEYFQDDTNQGVIGTSNATWSGSNMSITSTPLHDILSNLNLIPNGSALGSTVSSSSSNGFRAGIGIGADVFSTSNTYGKTKNNEKTTQNTLISFLDVNGDGLPDKVYKSGSSITYYKNTGSGFSYQSIPLTGIGSIGSTVSRTTSSGDDFNVFGFGIGKSKSRTFSQTDNYFLDFNADGLPDMVSGNKVLFNITASSNNTDERHFSNSVIDTENTIHQSPIIGTVVESLGLPTMEHLREEYPQFDHVLVWEAPYTGVINITGIAKVLQYNSPLNDGFRFTIERPQGNDLNLQGTTQIIKTGVITPSYISNNIFTRDMGVTSVNVSRGQMLFFRTHNLEHDIGGKLEWVPNISYTSFHPSVPIGINDVDDNNNVFGVYNAKNDFILNNGQNVSTRIGTTQMKINFGLPNNYFGVNQFSDDINFIVTKTRTNLQTGEVFYVTSWTRKYNHNNPNSLVSGTSNEFTDSNLPNQNDWQYNYSFTAVSNSNVKWNNLGWKPRVELYMGPSNVEIIYPGITYETYDDNPLQSKFWINHTQLPQPIINNDGNADFMTLSHNFLTGNYSGILSNLNTNQQNLTFKINWVIKEKTGNTVKTLHTKTFYLKRTTPSGLGNWNYQFWDENMANQLSANDIIDYSFYNFKKNEIANLISNNGRIYSALYIDHDILTLANNRQITLQLHSSQDSNDYPLFNNVALTAPYLLKSYKVSGYAYRGWSHFLYNGGLQFTYDQDGDIDNNIDPIDFSGALDLSKIPLRQSNFTQEPSLPIDPDTDPDTVGDGESVRVLYYTLNNQDKVYTQESIMTYDNNENTIGMSYGINDEDKLVFTVGRFAEPSLYEVYIDPEDLITGIGNTFVGVKQLSEANGTAKSGSAGALGISASGTLSESTSKVLTQYVDLNGDNYPDLVTESNIQYTNMRGGMGNVASNTFVVKDKSEDETFGISIAGSIANSTKKEGSGINKIINNTSAGINAGNGKSYDNTYWIDINGDGLTDKVETVGGTIRVMLNTGYGFTSSVNWGAGYNLTSTNRENTPSPGINFSFGSSFALGIGASNSEARTNYTFSDVNGDGLVDLVIWQSSQYRYYLNLGNKFNTSHNILFQGSQSIGKNHAVGANSFFAITGGIPIPIPPLFLTIKIIGSYNQGIKSSTFSETQASLQDINGDGLPDLLASNTNNNGTINAKLNKLQKTHLLKKVTTPLGGSWTIDYAREGNTYDLPQSKWVLSKLITDDGFTNDETYRPNKHITIFEYENPKYDRREREFLGFENVKTLQYLNFSNTPTTSYRTSVVTYHNSNYYLSGLQQLSQVFDQSNELLTEEKIYYNFLNPTIPQVNIEQALFNENGVYNPYTDSVLDKSRIFVAPVMIVSKSFEGSQFIAAEKKFLEYDGSGNLNAYYDKGEGGNDAYFTRIKYYTEQDMGITNARGYAKEITVHQNNEQGTLMRKRNAEYNSEGKLAKVSVTLTSDNDISEIGFKYDNYGNLTDVNQYNNFSIINSGYYNVTVNYDNKVHTYPIETQNSFGETSLAQYNYWYGIPILTTDKNMKNMRTRIDTRGRIVEVTGPNEYPNGWTIRMNYKGQNINYGNPIPQNPDVYPASGSFNAPTGATPPNYSSYAVTRHFDPHISGNQFLTVSIVDGFGQPIQLKKTHVNGTSVGWLVNSFDKQDGLGRSIKTYLPKFETNGYPTNLNNIPSTGLNYVGGSPAQHLSETTYDNRDRPVTIKQVGESEDTTITYTIETGMFVQDVENELNQRSKVYTDVRGRQRKTIQFYENEEIETNFRYNSINEKVKVINHFGYVTEYKYDLAGRRIEELSPDRGVTQFKYDLAGNMISKITSNLMSTNSSVQYSYDFGRLVQVVYPQNPQNNVTYKYGQEGDNLAEQKNAVGRLLTQEDATGIQLFAYGNMGELTTQVRSVAVAGYYRYWFLTQWEYDSWNRVKQIIYPDGERVNYNYNQAGMLKSVHASLPGNSTTDIVSNIFYNEFGERESIRYGNGTETRYEYDSRRRMQNLDYTFSTGNNSNYTIKKLYEYDAVSNITGIKTNFGNEQNLLNTISANGLIGGVINHNYEYDDLNRLKRADGTYVGANDFPGAPYLKHQYELNMRYNHDHTILSKTQTHVQSMVSSYNGSISSSVAMPQTNYHLEYFGYATGAEIVGNNYYGVQQPHAPREIVEYHDDQSDLDDPRTRVKKIKYDTNGNQLAISEQNGDEVTPLRVNLWDEENRLRGVDLKPSESSRPVAVYTYDANGERIIRYNYDNIDVASNSSHLGRASRDNVMIYPNGLIMAKPHILGSPGHTNNKSILSYTKHYYIGSERVGAKTGSSEDIGYFLKWYLQNNFSGINIANLDSSTENIQNNAKDVIIAIHESFGIDQNNYPNIQNHGSYGNVTGDFTHNMIGNISQFYFHPDHLGSSSYITNQSGMVSQHLEYLPFGELLIDEHTNSYNSPFKYNGKEFDEETGNYFYGARYYDPKWSIWISVDPLAEKYPAYSPYAYCINNPIMFVDPDGRDIIFILFKGSQGGRGVGHTAIAVSDYEKDKNGKYKKDKNGDYIKTGTYTIYDFNPVDTIGEKNFNETVRGKVSKIEGFTMDDILNSHPRFAGETEVSGVIEFKSCFEYDQNVVNKLESNEPRNKVYNLIDNNCSAFCSMAFSDGYDDKIGFETLKIGKNNYRMRTETKMFKDLSKFNGANIILNPGNYIDKTLQERFDEK